LLGSIEFLATLKCLIIICCFLPAEFWQKYAEVSELTGHVHTSWNYGNSQQYYEKDIKNLQNIDKKAYTVFWATEFRKIFNA